MGREAVPLWKAPLSVRGAELRDYSATDRDWLIGVMLVLATIVAALVIAILVWS